MSIFERAGAPAIYYEIDGTQGPWLVLSHSLGCDVSMWDPQLPALVGRYRVLRYDTRGHGRSAAGLAPYTLDELADDAAQLMEYLVDHGQFTDVPETFFFEHLEKCYPHLFSEQLPPLLGDMQSDLSRA